MREVTSRVFILVFAGLIFTACASGSSTVVGNARAPINPGEVKLYFQPPSDYEVIGMVSASSDAGLTEQATVDYAVRKLIKQAAKLGANGLLIESIDEQKSTAISGQGTDHPNATPVRTKIVSGQAIFVTE